MTDCVEGVCQCAVRAHLPAPQSVAYNRIWSSTVRDVEDRSYELNWSYEQPSNKMNDSDNDQQADELASFISVRVEKAENVLALGSIYRQVREYRHRVDRSAVGQKKQHFRQVIHHLEARSNFRIRIAAVDAHHCEGQIADLYFNSKSPLWRKTARGVFDCFAVFDQYSYTNDLVCFVFRFQLT